MTTATTGRDSTRPRARSIGTISSDAGPGSAAEHPGALAIAGVVALRAGNRTAGTYSGSGSTGGLAPGSLATFDQAIVGRLGQLGQAADTSTLGFVPPAEDEAILAKIRSANGGITDLITRILRFDTDGTPKKGQRMLRKPPAGPSVP